MDRLTRPDVAVVHTAARFMGTEVNIQDISDKLLHLILNGPTINSINKDTLRHLVRQLYTELKRYEDAGLTVEEVAKVVDALATGVAFEVSKICTVEGTSIPRLKELAEADSEGRLSIIPPPAKEGDPKPGCFYNDNAGLWCNGIATADGDEPTEHCKKCWYCEFGYAALDEDTDVSSKSATDINVGSKEE